MIPLYIREFAATYCDDIIQASKMRSSMFDLSGFSYDEIITEEDGTKVPVINTVNYQIPLMDILGLSRSEFAKPWPYQECLEAYDTYVSNLSILEGEDALAAIRKQVTLEQERIKFFDKEPEVGLKW